MGMTMGNTSLTELDWGLSDESELPEELVFPDPETRITSGQMKELEEYLRDFEESESFLDELQMHTLNDAAAEM